MAVGLTYLAISLFTAVSVEALDDDMLLYWRRSKSDASKCEPFTTYFIGCNKCVCNADGTEYCTRMACFKSKKFLSLAGLSRRSKKITPVQNNVNQKNIEDYGDILI